MPIVAGEGQPVVEQVPTFPTPAGSKSESSAELVPQPHQFDASSKVCAMLG